MDESTATAPARCEIARLPDDLLSATLARTTPRDACRFAAVSTDFRAAADGDAVWSSFLPRDLPPLADGDGEVPAGPPQSTKKQLFMRLSDSARPVLLADSLTCMWLERATGAKCYMVSARNLGIAWGDEPEYWSWIPITASRFPEAAKLRQVSWFKIRAEMNRKMFSQRTTYSAYIVFRLTDWRHGLGQEMSVSLGGSTSTRRVCLDDADDDRVVIHGDGRRRFAATLLNKGALFPRARGDGWMELEIGAFYSGEGEDGKVSFVSPKEMSFSKGSSLVLLGIEIRPKELVV